MKVAYAMVFVLALALVGFAVAADQSTSSSTPSATNDMSTHSSASMANRVIVGIVDKVDKSTNTITLKNVEKGKSGSSSSDMTTSPDATAPDSTTAANPDTSASDSTAHSDTYGSAKSDTLGNSFTFTSTTTISGKGKTSMSDVHSGDRVRLELDSSNNVQSLTVLGKS